METLDIRYQDLSSMSFHHLLLCGNEATAFDTFVGNEALTSRGQDTMLRALNDDDTFTVPNEQDLQVSEPSSPTNSESSWTGEDENGTLFFAVEQRLCQFLLAPDQTHLTLPPLNGQQRRIVHGIAHLMHLGHKTIRNGHLHRIHIFKKQDLTEGLLTSSVGGRQGFFAPSNMHHSETPHLETNSSCLETVQRSNNSTTSFESSQRMPKKAGGFPCRSQDCQKIFDRSCDRKKHEKLHEPRHNHRHRCSFARCDKAFMYPKDLRRHEKTHIRKTTQFAGEDESYTDDTSTNATESPLSKSLHSFSDIENERFITSMSYLRSSEDKSIMSEHCEPWFELFHDELDLSSEDNWLLHSTSWDDGIGIDMQLVT